MKLIKNEWVKLWAKKSTWIMIGILILSLIILLIGVKAANSSSDTNDWKEEQQAYISTLQDEIDNDELDEIGISYNQEEIKLAQYSIDHNINTTTSNTSHTFMSYSNLLMIFTSLFSIIVAAGIVSFEFSTGTIKMLLTRPINRWKILLSKLLTTFLFSILLTGVLYGLSYLLSVIFFSESGKELKIEGGQVIEYGSQLDSLKEYAFNAPDIIMSVLFAFMLGSLFRSSSLAIGLTLFLTFASATFVGLLSQYSFIKYFWFSVTDLSSTHDGTSIIPDLTVSFSIVIMSIYALAFIVASFLVFQKRDITS